MSETRNAAARTAVPVAIGVLLGFIAGYFAAGGGRPTSSPEESGRAAISDREDAMRHALDRDPENPKLLAALGNFYYDREDWDRAIAAYEKARRKAPKDPNVLSDLGSAFRGRGEFRMAESFFNKAREADPDHWQSLVNLTLLSAFDTRDASAARRHLEELKRRFPGIPNLDRIEKQIASLPARS
jgi:cytochrome c-type biogenesis protein CcmH/NrfG